MPSQTKSARAKRRKLFGTARDTSLRPGDRFYKEPSPAAKAKQRKFNEKARKARKARDALTPAQRANRVGDSEKRFEARTGRKPTRRLTPKQVEPRAKSPQNRKPVRLLTPKQRQEIRAQKGPGPKTTIPVPRNQLRAKSPRTRSPVISFPRPPQARSPRNPLLGARAQTSKKAPLTGKTRVGPSPTSPSRRPARRGPVTTAPSPRNTGYTRRRSAPRAR